MTGAESDLAGPAELGKSYICLHHASMFFVLCLLFHYVEHSRHYYTQFKVNSCHKRIWNTDDSPYKCALKYLYVVIELSVYVGFFILASVEL